MPSLRTCLALALLCSALVPAFAAEDGEQQMTLDQLPAAVKATLTKEAKGAALSEIEKETKKGANVYTAKIPGEAKETVIEITVAEDGSLIGRESEKQDADDTRGTGKGEH